MKHKSFEAWLEHLEKLHPKKIDLGLDRVRDIAEKLKLTSLDATVITVAGTNGKGSVVCFLESLYHKAGYRVAATTSPHIVRFNERIRIGMQDVSDYELMDAFETIETARGDQPLSYFEFCALAFLYIFKNTALDVILIEIGLGGRLDVFNIVEPDIAVITSIDLDHVDILGDTREAIGFEKAGIFRANTPAICGDPEVPHTVIDVANEVGAKLYCRDSDFSYEEHHGQWDFKGPMGSYKHLQLPKLKMQNIATSLMVAQCLQDSLPVAESVVRDCVHLVELPGRFEIINEPIQCIFDVAHNPHASAWLATQLSRFAVTGKVVAVTGMLNTKDVIKTFEPLAVGIDEWHVFTLPVEQAVKSVDLAQALKSLKVNISSMSESIDEAMEHVVQRLDEKDYVLAFGSFYTVAEMKRWIACREVAYD